MASQGVELVNPAVRSPDLLALGRRVQEIRGCEVDTHVLESGRNCLIFHKDKVVQYDDRSAPAQTAIFAAGETKDHTGYEDAVQQSWACGTAAKLVQDVTHTFLIAEMMAQALHPHDRIDLFHSVLQAAVETLAPKALVFGQSQQVIDPSDYLAAVSEPPIQRPGALNVRLFNISNTPGDMIMDTRGLEEIGLHDLQCHFRTLDPNDVGRSLYNLAHYIFENGPVIETGHTVAGIEADSRWHCRFEQSLLEPERQVLDIDPGLPYAAGRRDES